MIRFDTKKDMEHYDNLYHQIYEKDKEIERLNNVINELEKYLEKIIIDGGTRGSMTFWYRQIYEYLKELKEGK